MASGRTHDLVMDVLPTRLLWSDHSHHHPCRKRARADCHADVLPGSSVDAGVCWGRQARHRLSPVRAMAGTGELDYILSIQNVVAARKVVGGGHFYTVHMRRDGTRDGRVHIQRQSWPIRDSGRGKTSKRRVEADAQRLTVNQAPRWLAVTIVDALLGVGLVVAWIALLSRLEMQRDRKMKLYVVFSAQLL